MDVTAGATAQKKQLRKVIQLLEAFRSECHPFMPVQQVVAFLRIMDKEGDIDADELQDRLGMSQQAMSRTINAFTELNFRKEKGYDMLRYTVDPMDMRRKRITMKPKGKRFALTVAAILES